jgi:hypothetical protein
MQSTLCRLLLYPIQTFDPFYVSKRLALEKRRIPRLAQRNIVSVLDTMFCQTSDW